MNGLHPYPQQGPEIRENWRTTREALGELYFNPVYRAGDGAVSAGAVFVSGTIPRASTVEFPAAGQPFWRIPEVRRDRWRAADVRVTVWYSAAAGSTNNFVFVWSISGVNASDVTSATAAVGATLTIPGPAVANTVLKSVSVAQAVIPGDKELLLVRFMRDKLNAADTNANSLHVLAVRLEVLPAQL